MSAPPSPALTAACWGLAGVGAAALLVGVTLLARAGRLADPTLSGFLAAAGLVVLLWGALQLFVAAKARRRRAWSRVAGLVTAGLGATASLLGATVLAAAGGGPRAGASLWLVALAGVHVAILVALAMTRRHFG